MATTTHHPIHLPASIVPALHWTERVLGAAFLTLLAPIAFALAILSALILAMGLGALI